jgi:hypothetical protein
LMPSPSQLYFFGIGLMLSNAGLLTVSSFNKNPLENNGLAVR